MKTYKHVVATQFICWLLLIAPPGYAITSADDRSNSNTTNEFRYLTGELLELHPKKIVTSVGTFSTTYIMVLDQRLPATTAANKKSETATKGKVQLKFDQFKQLLEVILY